MVVTEKERRPPVEHSIGVYTESHVVHVKRASNALLTTNARCLRVLYEHDRHGSLLNYPGTFRSHTTFAE